MYCEERSYYDICGISAEDVIDGLNLVYREGAAVKYLFRCNKVMPKGEMGENLRKCRHYISRCKKNPVPLRSKNADYFIQKINPDVFDEDIFNALIEILNASEVLGKAYGKYMDKALNYTNNAIERY